MIRLSAVLKTGSQMRPVPTAIPTAAAIQTVLAVVSPRTCTWPWSASLTRVIRQLNLPWCELDRDLIQPVCWSRPGVFFGVATDKEHAARINERSLCYMLANTTMRLWSRLHPKRSLLGEGTFFRYVYQRALVQERRRKTSCESVLQFSTLVI